MVVLPVTDVVCVRWPEDAPQLDRLRALGAPRLVLVAPDADPPVCADCEEDWIRLPASDADVRARIEVLVARAARHVHRPLVDPAGRLLFQGRWVALSRLEQRIAHVLVESFGAVVDRRTLAARAWPAGDVNDRALNVVVLRMRRRLAPLGLAIRVVRGHGYLLELGRSPSVSNLS